MKTILSTATRLALALGLLASSATLASAADLNPKNLARPSGGVHVQGASGISGWAVVADDATLVRKLNAKTALSLDTGRFEVAFNSNITKCAYTGTVANIGSSGSFNAPATIVITGRSGNVKALYIETFDSTGVAANMPFHVLVTC